MVLYLKLELVPTLPCGIILLWMQATLTAYEVQRRMIESGEWDRLSATLSQRLAESGWVDDVHHRTKETARSAGSQHEAKARQLMADVRDHAEGSVPPTVRQEIKALIRQYLESQIDK
ncbi:transcription factor e(y)2-domain-containing protein [Cytidiella melzeri]|nr:transcription factor e(y)2-domain-containing protein [Cytidiella melzeri]